jgi:adenylate cyclase
MWESVWQAPAGDYVKALIAGSAPLAVQWIAPRVMRLLRRLHRSPVCARPPRRERRLIAILAVDVAGYSRLMETDEEGTYRRLVAVRQAVMERKTDIYRGRVVKTTGDGVLFAFESVVDALQYAVDVQQAVAECNVKQEREHQIWLRMGVSVGDVLIERADIYGEGVNLAVRLESLAAPGGIWISADAWRYARGRVSVQATDLGQHSLKNMTEPAQVYAIAPFRSVNASAGQKPAYPRLRQ